VTTEDDHALWFERVYKRLGFKLPVVAPFLFFVCVLIGLFAGLVLVGARS